MNYPSIKTNISIKPLYTNNLIELSKRYFFNCKTQLFSYTYIWRYFSDLTYDPVGTIAETNLKTYLSKSITQQHESIGMFKVNQDQLREE